MMDIWTNDNDNSDNENHDQQEIESYLYSLVHHGSLDEECQQESGESALSPEDDDPTPAAQKTWRYFNSAPSRDKGGDFSQRLKLLSGFYTCNKNQTNNPKVHKSFFWRQPITQALVHRKRVATMEGMKDKVNENPPLVISLNSANNPNCEDVSEIICIDDVERNDISEKHCASSSHENTCRDIAKASANTDDDIVIIDSSLSPCKENVERTNNRTTKVPSQVNDEINNDLNNTNPSLSSYDDHFELPSRPKSKSALNESMTQVLQVMLDEDASRSSIDSSDKRPVQKSKTSSKPGSGTGWTVGMSWEDMSSKFRFNFEVDSVCGDSVREESISASSRANTPEGVVPTSPQDVSKYDVSLKTTNNTDVVDMDIDNSDSEGDSVVEVVKPDKEPPPIVEILSDCEDITPSKIKKLDKSEGMEEDIVVLFEAVVPVGNNNCVGDGIPAVVTPLATRSSPAAVCSNRFSPAPQAAKRELAHGISASGPAKKKERNRKKAKQGKVSKRGESDHGLGNILATMSDDPKLWRICREDMYPRPAGRKLRPCDNCKQRDHFPWHCTEPVKIKVCSMCGEPGHSSSRCPDRMCLNCGAPTWQYVKNCRVCTKKTVCDICLWRGHQSKECPDLWRRYYMTTSKGPPVEPPPDFQVRPPTEMWCCNCARKGHISDTCPTMPSGINEKRLSYVVSYVDPTRGKSDLSHQLVASASSAAGKRASSSNRCLRAVPKGLPPPSNPPEAQNRVKIQALVNVCSKAEFKNNYKKFLTKLQSVDLFPAEPTALADYLENQLEHLKTPVLTDTQVRMSYLRLLTLMEKCTTTKKTIRRALLCASKINMTVLGFGGLGGGTDLVNDLRGKIKQLRLLRTSKVPFKVKTLINEPFTQLFKGSIREDLNSLVMEYLKRRKRDSA